MAGLWMVLVAGGGMARAAPAEPDPFVADATTWMEEAEYSKAQKVINRGLSRENLGDDVLLSLYLLEGTCWVSLGQPERARSSYVKVLTLRPSYELDARTSPKVRAVFEATRGEMLRLGDLESVYEPAHTPVGNRVAGQGAPLRVRFAREVGRVVLHVRRLGTSDFTSMDAVRDDVAGQIAFVARVPPYFLTEEREAYSMEYFLEAFSASGRRVAGVGSAVLPLSFLVVPSAELDARGDGEETSPAIWPVAAGVGVVTVGIAALSIGVALALTPKTGSALVTVRQ